MCEGDSRTISCPPGQSVQVAWVQYGRKDNELCNDGYDLDDPALNQGTPCMMGKKATVAKK